MFFYVCTFKCLINPLTYTPILGLSNSIANKDMMSKIWTNGDTIIRFSRKNCGKRRNCLLRAISPSSAMFSKAVCCCSVKMSIYGVKQSPMNPLVCSYLRVRNGQGRMIFLTRLSGRSSDNKKSDLTKYFFSLDRTVSLVNFKF